MGHFIVVSLLCVLSCWYSEVISHTLIPACTKLSRMSAVLPLNILLVIYFHKYFCKRWRLKRELSFFRKRALSARRILFAKDSRLFPFFACLFSILASWQSLYLVIPNFQPCPHVFVGTQCRQAKSFLILVKYAFSTRNPEEKIKGNCWFTCI